LKLRNCLACTLLTLASFLQVFPVGATSFSTDQSDLWWNPAESGWGIQFVQRGSVIFATTFVYGPGGLPIWYTATMNPVSPLSWAGDLYATTGPYFGTVPFNPAAVALTKVGTMNWSAQTVTTGTLTYSVNNVTVSRALTRQTLVLDDYSGHYFGGAHREIVGCNDSAFNGVLETSGTLSISQNGQAMTIQSSNTAGGACSFTGTVSQTGQMGTFQGTFVCNDGSAGTMTLFEMQVTISSLSTRFSTTYTSPAGCRSSGWLGGMRGTTF
jgi:hypothetical protein